jgi:hypothetical protein
MAGRVSATAVHDLTSKCGFQSAQLEEEIILENRLHHPSQHTKSRDMNMWERLTYHDED